MRKLAAEIIDETNDLSYIEESTNSLAFGENFNLSTEVRNYEKRLIKHALKLSQGNQTKATKILGIKLTTLNTKIKVNKILTDRS